jgi:hypothetical protein
MEAAYPISTMFGQSASDGDFTFLYKQTYHGAIPRGGPVLALVSSFWQINAMQATSSSV